MLRVVAIVLVVTRIHCGNRACAAACACGMYVQGCWLVPFASAASYYARPTSLFCLIPSFLCFCCLSVLVTEVVLIEAHACAQHAMLSCPLACIWCLFSPAVLPIPVQPCAVPCSSKAPGVACCRNMHTWEGCRGWLSSTICDAVSTAATNPLLEADSTASTHTRGVSVCDLGCHLPRKQHTWPACPCGCQGTSVFLRWALGCRFGGRANSSGLHRLPSAACSTQHKWRPMAEKLCQCDDVMCAYRAWADNQRDTTLCLLAAGVLLWSPGVSVLICVVLRRLSWAVVCSCSGAVSTALSAGCTNSTLVIVAVGCESLS